MRKYFLLFITLLFLLTGCAEKQSNVNGVDNPYEIKCNNQILSYYDTKDQIRIDNFNILENNLQNFWSENNSIFVNQDGIIRCISIMDANVVTYKSISVGDNIKKIEESFENVGTFQNTYTVLFNGNSEEDSSNQSKGDDWLWINYITDGSKITQIQIYDVQYGREMR